MRKLLTVLLALALSLSLASCTAKEDEEKTPENADVTRVYTDIIDLTALSDTEAIEKINNICENAADYIGRRIKLTGSYGFSVSPEGNRYSCTIINIEAGAVAYIEFVLSGEHTFPDDYPSDDAVITLEGTLETYTEGEDMYCRLVDAVITY